MTNMDDLNNMSDEDLIAAGRIGNGAAADVLLRRYMPMVKAEAKPLFLKGADEEDLIQEGMLGLFQALRDYDADRGASFKTFAVLCVRRHLCSAVEASARRKHDPLNTAVSYDVPDLPDAYDAATSSDTDAMFSPEDNPEEAYISEESSRRLMEDIRKELSPLERQVFDLYLEGVNYRDIAARLGRKPKSIDNALQRIRHKTRQLLDR